MFLSFELSVVICLCGTVCITRFKFAKEADLIMNNLALSSQVVQTSLFSQPHGIHVFLFSSNDKNGIKNRIMLLCILNVLNLAIV